MMPPPLQDVTAPMLDLADDEADELATDEHQRVEPQHQPQQRAEQGGGEQGGRKRRRRGRRGGRRRRREGGQDGAPHQEEQRHGSEAPIAEQVEYEMPPPPPSPEEVARDLEAALEAPAAPSAQPNATESVPVSERGDQVEVTPPPEPAAAPQGANEGPRHAVSVPVPTHEVSGPPSNPKRGWWRRIVS